MGNKSYVPLERPIATVRNVYKRAVGKPFRGCKNGGSVGPVLGLSLDYSSTYRMIGPGSGIIRLTSSRMSMKSKTCRSSKP
ncbi:unnamed protein product [Caenorhabditis auriculariae]|uniref:Uncharacterized protein n=1 Tax=Caenorhabditis auriculariae TaxID=2777116 RepID=A0A8S1GVE8_9PELO|nr:unnamed protein product [Caenorhabditis auriculariae]